MGGGGAMRTVAKAAGIGIYNSSLRNVAAENFTPARRAASVRSTFSSSSLTLEEVDSNGGIVVDHPQQSAGSAFGPKPVSEFDDWEFAGSEDGSEFVVDKVEATSPRVVFSHSPTIEETKEATSDLKNALEKAYFSLASSQSDDSDARTCIITETPTAPSVTKSAMQAFSLLRENPVAQTVVASIACDPKVWQSVMQNEALMDYLKSEKSAGNDDIQSPLNSVNVGNEKVKYGFSEFVEDVKLKASDVKLKVSYFVNNVTIFFKDLFEVQTAKPTMENVDGPTAAAGGAFLALAVMVIMVVVFKRFP